MKKSIIHIVNHTVIVSLSAAFAYFLPDIIRQATRTVLYSWSYIENQALFLVCTEIAVAILLIVGVNMLGRSWRVSRNARSAHYAGLVNVAPAQSILARRSMKKLKVDQGTGRNIMLISATGLSTFVDPAGDLHEVVKQSREAKIMLLNPLREGVTARAKSLADPNITPESFREQIIRSIDFLKGLKAHQKNIRLKLYPDVPLLKMAILGDYLCMQHYPAGLNVRQMPEYAFQHDGNGGLFNVFYQYFVSRWFDPLIPEYDLETDELIYRDKSGTEVRRESFNEVMMEY